MNNEFYILILTKGVVKMNIKDVPFTQEVIKDAIGNGEVEFFNFSPNSKSGIKNLEMKIYYPNGQRKVIILHDYGVQIRSEEVITLIYLITVKNATKRFCVYIRRKIYRRPFWQIYSD